MSAPRPGVVVPEESAEELYEGAPCGYLSTTPDGTIVRVNRTFLDWTGYARDDLVHRRRFQELLTAGGRIYHETHYAPLLRMQGTVREIAVDMVRADGSRLPVLLNSVQRMDAAGHPVAVRTTIFNATDRKLYEGELLRARERAERLQDVTARLAAAVDRRAIAVAVVDAVSAGTRATGAALTVAENGAEPAVVQGHGDAGATTETFPLVASAGVLGELSVDLAAGGLDPGERTFVRTCAAQAAQALERASLHQETRDVASALQQSLLALEVPDDARFSVATRYITAVETLDVGGDWYDAFALDRRRLALVVGDVVGRGLEAATAMGQLRSAVRALALADLGPGPVIDRLDRFARPLEPAQMATVALCEVDLDSGITAYACAGHPPPVVLPPDGPPAFLWGGRSAPLAARVSATSREQARAAIEPGSRLLLYTDGLVERRGATIDDGLARLLAELDARRDAAPDELVDGLTDALLADTATPDDVCVLCAELRRGGDEDG